THQTRVPRPCLALSGVECKPNHARGGPRAGTRRPRGRRPRGVTVDPRSGDHAYPFGLRALLALRDVELHPLAVIQSLVSIHLNGCEVNEHVRSAVHGDEAVALLTVEPFDGTLCHAVFPHS